MTYREHSRSAVLGGFFAISALTSSAQTDSPQQHFGGASLPALVQLADAGNGAAQRDLGLVFLFGADHRRADAVLALQWFEAAALHGDVRAASYIGDFYLGPANGPVELDSGRFWYRKAHLAQDARGTVALAALSCKGIGTPVDLPHCGVLLDEALQYRSPSDPPDVNASLQRYDLLVGSAYQSGKGVPGRMTLAASWYDKAASLGYVPAAVAESRLYSEPGGLRPNLPKAIAILDSVTAIALAGSVPNVCKPARFEAHDDVTQAYVNIGAHYEARGERWFPQALAAYNKAAALGEGAPAIALGLRYANGTGVVENLDKAQTILLALTQSSAIKLDDRVALSIALKIVAIRSAVHGNTLDTAHLEMLTKAAQREAIFVCPTIAEAYAASALPLPPVERYPNLQAPDTVAPLQIFTVQVSLNTVQFDNNTQVLNVPQSNGRLQFTLPEGLSSMPVDVALIAPGMTFVAGSTNTATLTLDSARPNSTPATFQVQAPATTTATELIATLTYHQTFLAQLARDITIAAPPLTLEPAATRSDNTPIGAHTEPQNPAPKPPILTLNAPRPGPPAPQPLLPNATGRLSDLTIIETLVGDSMSYQIIGPAIDPSAPSLVPNAAATALKVQADYSQLQAQALLLAAGTGAACASDRAAHAKSAASCTDAVFSRGLIEGIGTDLYTHDAPDSFRMIYQQMLAAHTRLHSITIVSNNPLLPWELMCVPAPTGKGCNLLGLTTAIVRENSAAPQLAQAADIPFSAINVVAPNYTGTLSLAGAAAELKNIKATFPRTTRIDGDASSVSTMVKAAPEGIIHFSGHGKRVTSTDPTATKLAPRVAIALEDYDMTPDTFVAFRAEGDASAHPFYFFNACDLGQSDKELTYVAGWAPELMRSGAAGYLGALYEVGDLSASSFAAHFYAGLKANLAGNQAWTMAELVTWARQQTYAESNDPTALAYVLYAKPFMRLVGTQ